MPILTLPTTVQLETVECYSCSMVFGLPKLFVENRRADHKSWFCPLGHSNYWPGESEEERLRRVLHEAQLARERAERQAREAQNGEQAALTAKQQAERKLKRVKHRVANGTCPCCNRSFVNLQRHMANQHPDFEGEEA